MPSFVDFPLDTDEERALDRFFEHMRTVFPGWTPNEAHLEVAVAEEMVRISQETAVVATQVGEGIFRAFGEKLVRLQKIAGAYAGTTVTFTAIDTQGYTIPAGTLISRRVAGDTEYVFRTIADAVITPGTTQANVGVHAVELGSLYNGLVAGPFTMVDALLFISSVTSTAVTSGGADEETDETYLDRLSDELTLLTPRPILPDDFAVLARRVAGVARAKVIDGYNPTDQTSSNERMVTVVGVDKNGQVLASKEELRAYLDSLREANFVVNVVDPTYLKLDIVYNAIAVRGSDPAVVRADIDKAIADYINPAKWAGGDLSPPEWRGGQVVRHWELVTLINNVTSVDYLISLTINGGTADVLIPGVAGLPRAVGPNTVTDSTITGTVTS